MLVLIAIILGFLIGKIRRGSLKGFKVRKISLLPLGIIGFLLQIALHFYSYTGGIAFIEPYLQIVNFASYILVLVMLVFNLDDFWVILMAIGFTANFVVIFINGGQMPVAQQVIDILPTAFAQTITQGTNPIYSLIQPNTLLWFLGINLPLPIPYVPMAMSLYGTVAGVSGGTVVALIGFIGFIQYVMNKKQSIITDETLDFKDEDEGIFGEGQDSNIEGVSIQNTGALPEVAEVDSFSSLYRDLEGGGIRGERDETTVVAQIKDDIVLPGALPEDDYRLEIGTETEEIVVPDRGEEAADFSEETTVMFETENDGSTKILETIQEAGTFVVGGEARTLEASEMEEIVNSEDTGFFTKKYYEEKLAIERERLMAQMREMQIEEAAKPKPEPKPIPVNDLRVVDGFKLTDLETPFVLMGETQGNQQEKVAPEVTEEVEEFTEDEMLNVWERLNLEDEKRKAKRRKETIQQTIQQANAKEESLLSGSPFGDAGIPLKEIEEVTEEVVEKVYESPNKEGIMASMDEKQRKSFNATIEKRKKAGYELVELKLDGKDVAFWRKKK
ncbi:MAG: DUF5317 domain-containing protein [Eubacteriaceae bacterium]